MDTNQALNLFLVFSLFFGCIWILLKKCPTCGSKFNKHTKFMGEDFRKCSTCGEIFE